MPWDVFRTGSDEMPYCVHKLNDDGSQGERVPGACHATEAEAEAQVAALYANEPGAGEKRANLHDWLVSRIHRDFTVTADEMLGTGILTQEERIALSAGIGDALDAFNTFLDANLPHLRERGPWDDAPDGAMKIGARNAAADMRRIQDVHDLAVALGASCEMEGEASKDADMAMPSMGGPIKALGGNRIGGYGVLWGSPAAKDLAGEYFTPETEELTAIFAEMGGVPGLYQHAMDRELKSAVTGVIDVMVPDAKGLWVEEQLKLADGYAEDIRRLIDEGKLFWSSGTLPGARRVAKDGHIKRWPIVELSKTPTPAEFRMLERPIEAVKALYIEAGLTNVQNLPETEGEAGETSEGRGAEDARQTVIRARLGLLELMSLETTEGVR